MTNRQLLKLGIKYLAWALPLLFIGPGVVHMAFKNKQHLLFIPVLGMGIIISILAVVFVFRGIQTMVNSITDPQP